MLGSLSGKTKPVVAIKRPVTASLAGSGGSSPKQTKVEVKVEEFSLANTDVFPVNYNRDFSKSLLSTLATNSENSNLEPAEVSSLRNNTETLSFGLLCLTQLFIYGQKTSLRNFLWIRIYQALKKSIMHCKSLTKRH